jgi:hypothetical protein
MGRNAESGTIGELMRGADEPFRERARCRDAARIIRIIPIRVCP